MLARSQALPRTGLIHRCNRAAVFKSKSGLTVWGESIHRSWFTCDGPQGGPKTCLTVLLETHGQTGAGNPDPGRCRRSCWMVSGPLRGPSQVNQLLREGRFFRVQPVFTRGHSSGPRGSRSCRRWGFSTIAGIHPSQCAHHPCHCLPIHFRPAR